MGREPKSKVIWGDCHVCGGKAQLWRTTPRVMCCGRIMCRAMLFWDRERWEGQWVMAQSRKRLGLELGVLDTYARRVVQGKVTSPVAVMLPPAPKKQGRQGRSPTKRVSPPPTLL